jgi:predicted alpha/beta-hydrolase family hydrolase
MGMDSPFMTTFAKGLAAQGESVSGLKVARFEFPYMQSQREGRKKPPDKEPVLLESWRNMITSVVETSCPRNQLLIGGKSLGGRMASLIADEQKVAGLICLGYPFHPPGKPQQLRIAHLQTLKTPALICQGTRDPFGKATEVASYNLSETIQIHWVEDGDHSFKPPRASGWTETKSWELAMTKIINFIGKLP